MGAARQRNLVLILFRELAAHVASPVFVVDAEGTLVFYNERAEQILGMAYADAGELAAGEWGTKWDPRDLDGKPLPVEELPLVMALNDRRPSHLPMRIKGVDGVERDIEVTAFPLFAHTDDFVGAVAIFWEP